MVNPSDTPPYRTLTSEPLYGGVTVLADSSEPRFRRAVGGMAAGGEAVSNEAKVMRQRKGAMMIRNLVATACGLGILSCAEPPPTAPPVEAARLPAGTVSQATIDPRAAAAGALEDARHRIVPAFQADPDYSSLRATAALEAALDALATALERQQGLATAVRRAELALAGLDDSVKADPGRAADLAVVRMAVQLTYDVH